MNNQRYNRNKNKNRNNTRELANKKTFNRASIRKKLDKDLEIGVMNNTNGRLVYTCPKTHARIDISDFGGMDVLTLEQLNTMKNSSKAILEKYWLVLINVYSDEVTLEEIIYYLGLDKLYDGLEFDTDLLDSMILDSTVNEFEDTLQGANKYLVMRVAERAKKLYIDKKFGDRYKQNFLIEYTKIEDLF